MTRHRESITTTHADGTISVQNKPLRDFYFRKPETNEFDKEPFIVCQIREPDKRITLKTILVNLGIAFDASHPEEGELGNIIVTGSENLKKAVAAGANFSGSVAYASNLDRDR